MSEATIRDARAKLPVCSSRSNPITLQALPAPVTFSDGASEFKGVAFRKRLGGTHSMQDSEAEKFEAQEGLL
jgi:hypothetical protein